MAASPNLDALTSLRFLAALWVVLFHHGRMFLSLTPAAARNTAKAGYVGVSSFFLLSGFVLAYAYLPRVMGGQFRAREFWWARMARLYPLYLLVFVCSCPAALLAQPFKVFVRLALLQAWLPDDLGGWNLPAWSLSAEAFFYAVFPLAILGAAKLEKRWLLPLALGMAGLALLPPAAFILFRPHGLRTSVDQFSFATTVLKMNPLIRLPDFLAGVLLGAAYVRLSLREKLLARPVIRRTLFFGGLALTVLLIGLRRSIPWELAHNGLFLLPFGLLLVALSPGAGTAASLLSYRLPKFLGEISYAIYIIHVPLHSWLETRFFSSMYDRSSTLFFEVYFAALILVSAALHLLVEQPARRWLRGRPKLLGIFRRKIGALG